MWARIPRRSWLSFLVIAAAVLVPLPAMLNVGGMAMEEGLLVVGGARVLDGAWPNRDFEHLYGPGGMWALAGTFAVFGVSFTAERLLGLAYRVLLLWAVHRITRRWGTGVATGATLVTWAVIAPFGLIAYSWVGGAAFATAGLACALDAEDRGRRWWVAAGLLSGIALLYRPDLVVAVALGALLPLRRAAGPERLRWLAGASVAVVGYVVHLAVAGPSAAVQGMFVDPVVRLRPGRRLPMPPSWTSSSEFFSRLSELTPETLPGLPRPAQLALLFWLLVAAALLTPAMAWRWRDRRLGAYGLLALGTVPQMLQRPSMNHLRFVGSLVFAGTVVVVARLVHRDRIAGAVAAVAVMLVLVAVSPSSIGRYSWQTFVTNPFSPPAAVDVVNGDRRIPIGSTEARDELQSVVDDLQARSEPGQRLFVGPVDLSRTNYSQTSLYHLFPDLVPASYHLEMNPGLANRQGGRLADDVASADWLLLTPLFDGWTEANASGEPGDTRANQVVADEFCEVDRTPSYVLLGRCAALEP